MIKKHIKKDRNKQTNYYFCSAKKTNKRQSVNR
jgi:hypothetical protein